MVIKINYTSSDVYVSTSVSPVYVVVNYSGTSGGGGNFVPYTGATADVDLGEFALSAGQVTLDTTPTGTAAVATTRWNDTIGSSETTLKGGNVVLKNGVDLVARVVNKVTPNTTLTKANYQAVKISGAQGQRLAVALAQANNDTNSADTIGLVTETIATNQEGFIMTVGNLEGINTTGSLQGETWADGDVLYLSPTTAGRLTNIKPTGATGHIVVVGYVEYSHINNGKIYVKIMNGWELDELHNVYITSPTNNDALIYESATQLWKNKTIATALGYTPVPTTRTLTINGTAYDLSADRSWTVTAGITGSGVANQITYWNGTGSVTGSAGLVYNDSTGIITLNKNQNINTELSIINANTGASSQSVLRLTNGTDIFAITKLSSANGGLGWVTGNSAWLYSGQGNLDLTTDNNSKRIRFGTLNGAGSPQMSLTGAGRLLLGTTTESTFLLDVNGTARVSVNSQTGGDGIGLTIQDNGGSPSVGAGINYNTPNGISGAIRWTINVGYNNTGLRFFVNNNSGILTEAFRVTETQNVLVGSTTNVPSAILGVTSTTKGFLPPRMTTTQKNAIGTPAAGLQVYDTTLNQMSYYNGTSWVNF